MVHLKNTYFIISIIAVIYWMIMLTKSTAIIIPYIICGILSILAVSKKEKIVITNKKKNQIFFLGCIFGSLITIANHEVYSATTLFESIIQVLLFWVSGIIISYNISCFLYEFHVEEKLLNNFEYNFKNKFNVFIISFILILCVDVLYLFLVAYPGNLSSDSIDQLTQAQTGNYYNHHPVYHTIIIKLFTSLGMRLFGNINAAIATYSMLQIIIMAAIFSFAILTLYEMGLKKKWLFIALSFYTFMPYNWIYACTMWKDVLFGGFCLLFIVTLYRHRHKIGSNVLNVILFCGSIVVICLFRSNGFYAVLLFFMLLVFFLFKTNKKIIIFAALSICVAATLRGPILSFFHISSADTVEALSIPLQQVARTIYDGKELTKEQYSYVNRIMDIELVGETYKEYISDPIKQLAREKGANNVINENRIQFVRTWITIGLQHPYDYFVAWIDQTRGYWNAGYHYGVASNGIAENDLGIVRKAGNEKINAFIDEIITRISYSGDFVSIFVATGFFMWIYILLIGFNLIDKKDGYLELFFPVTIIISLLIATPVFNEFRYVYCIYTMMPMAFSIGLKVR